MLITILLALGIIFFLIANLVKFFTYQKMPVHLRWELYPVPHENPARAVYGGSRVEETMWWMQPYKKNKIGAFKYFALEVVLLKAVWEHNRKIWIWSYLMHTGLYAAICSTVLLCMGSLLDFAGLLVIAQSGASFGGFFYDLLDALLLYAACAVFAGSVGLFTMRMRDESFREMSNRENWINLVFLAVISGLLSFNALANETTSIHLLVTTQALFTFSAAPQLPVTLLSAVILGVLFLFYFPFTSMTHLYTKWFTYHSVRWDDAAASETPGDNKQLTDAMNYGVDWAGVHITPAGKKNWADVVTDDPAVIGKNRTNGNHKIPPGAGSENH
jgi:nitrate reductase gamma subunit